MVDRPRRDQLRQQYEQRRPKAVVYRLVNCKNKKFVLGSAADLRSLENKVAFAKATNLPGALDGRLNDDVRQFGIEAFSLEVLEVLETKPEATPAEILEDLAALEELWREKFDPAQLY